MDIFLLSIKQYLLFVDLHNDRTGACLLIACAIPLRGIRKTCFSKIDNFDIELINFNSIKTNIKRMASEIPTNLLIISNFHLINSDIIYWNNHIVVDELKNLKL